MKIELIPIGIEVGGFVTSEAAIIPFTQDKASP